MAAKHDLFQDPEYEDIADTQQNKRIKLMEDSGRNQTTKKIGNIIKSNYLQEIDAKTSTLDNTLKNLLKRHAQY
ncbi:hypothetical protein CEXT_51951 [Caerostris extrusa]|uniref:Uncharacterized protein n=1 Tax=Caerostris extrusa TaxID=172846 RepID=A0AAV4PLF7_CAEEX|nr:hypothetical protein CEXT_51951 [Caerostris extrusa]